LISAGVARRVKAIPFLSPLSAKLNPRKGMTCSTPSAESPGMPRCFGLRVPIPRKTASYSLRRASKSVTLELRRSSTPRLRTRLTSSINLSRGNL